MQEMIEAAQEEEQELAAEMAAQFLNEDRQESLFGAPKAGAGMWASIIRVLNPINGQTLQKISLEQNEAAHRSVQCLAGQCCQYTGLLWVGRHAAPSQTCYVHELISFHLDGPT